MKRDLFLISNSTNAGEQYLGWIKNDIIAYCKQRNIKQALFIPYAGVNVGRQFEGKTIQDSYDLYFDRVKHVFEPEGLTMYSIHKCTDPLAKHIEDAECIITGGGNTFHLVYMLHKLNLMECISQRILKGCPYVGWSAGANIACPTMKTTNDMPVIEPESFNTLNVVPFQINPHYLDANPAGHGGETREDRIKEFLVVNPSVTVAGLREATALVVKDDNIKLVGSRKIRIFRHGQDPQELSAEDDLNVIL
jgi:dipeptidase E